MEGATPLNPEAKANLHYINSKVSPLLNDLSLILLVERPEDPEYFLIEYLQQRRAKGHTGPTSRPKAADLDLSRLSPMGPYSTLANFLADCRQYSWVSDDRLTDLMFALDGLSLVGDGCNRWEPAVLRSMPHAAPVLSSMGFARQGAVVVEPPAPPPTYHATSGKAHATVLGSPAFDCSTCGDIQQDAKVMLQTFMAPHDLVRRFQIDEETLESWIKAIAVEYNNGGAVYHTFAHAFDVLQFCHLCLSVGHLAKFFNLLENLALLCAAVGQDVGHPGRTNAFLVATGHNLALTYNDRSPLESMHASVFFQTLKQPGLNFLERLAGDEFQRFRHHVVEAILATDASQHFKLLDRFAALPCIHKGSPDPLSMEQWERSVLLQAVLYTSTLSHCFRPWDIHKRLVVALEEEYFLQGDDEKNLGLPVTPLMDRARDSLATCQPFFLQRIAAPLADPYRRFLSAELGTATVEFLANNAEKWEALVATHGTECARRLLEKDRQAFLEAQHGAADQELEL